MFVINVIKYCQEMFHFELPRITLQKKTPGKKNLKVNIAMLTLF